MILKYLLILAISFLTSTWQLTVDLYGGPFGECYCNQISNAFVLALATCLVKTKCNFNER